MAENTHIFKLQSVWTGDSGGTGTATGDGWTISYGRPSSLGGQSGRANPEELLLSAVVSCYCITLAILAERKRIPLERIEMAAKGDVEQQLGGTLKFAAIRLSPRLISPGLDESRVLALTEAVHKAELYCPISNAIRGNVRIEVSPEVVA